MSIRALALALATCALLMPACGDDATGPSDTGGQETVAPSPAGEDADTSGDDPSYDY